MRSRRPAKGSTAGSRCSGGSPVSLLVKHFTKAGKVWEMSSDIRRRIEFRALTSSIVAKGSTLFDVIFCRNVLIYFDDATRRAVLARLAARLSPDGYLVLGTAETTTGTSESALEQSRRKLIANGRDAPGHCRGLTRERRGYAASDSSSGLRST
jgi:chemotaxis protein methyltransferase CheR